MSFKALIKSRTLGTSKKGNPYIRMQLAIEPGAVAEFGQARYTNASRWAATEEDLSNLVPGAWVSVNKHSPNEGQKLSVAIWEYEVTDPPEEPERCKEIS